MSAMSYRGKTNTRTEEAFHETSPKMLILCILTASLLFRTDAYSKTQGADDRTLSPYFMVVGDDADLDRLPLKSTRASVKIAGVIADVQVTQVYHNEGIKPLEAVYVFPASTRAAVYGMKMTIGKRTIEAGIKKRQDARLAYEQARDEGRSASLLEQQRPNVFQMNVANILPGDEIRVELKYTELVVPEDRVYEFVDPTVTGPRYPGAGSEPWPQTPTSTRDNPPAHAFDIQVGIHAGMPIREVSCPSHKVQVAYRGAETADVFLDRSESEGGNRDFILRYRLDGERIQSGLLLSEGGKENFFLLMVQPPQRVKKTDIPGREYIFIVDVSGSMPASPWTSPSSSSGTSSAAFVPRTASMSCSSPGARPSCRRSPCLPPRRTSQRPSRPLTTRKAAVEPSCCPR